MMKQIKLLRQAFSRRWGLLRSNLDLKETLRLIWSVEKKWTVYNVAMIVLESGLFFISLYWLKVLIDSVSNAGGDLRAHKQDILLNILLAGIFSVLYMIAKAISAYVTEKQSARVAEYLDDRIHAAALELDLSFYESPDYFDILKRAKDAGADRPALLIKTLSEIVKNLLTFAGIAAILVTIDWVLIPVLFVFVVPILLVRVSFADALNTWRIKQTPVERQAHYLGSLITSETTAKEIRSYGLGHYFRPLYLKIRLDLLAQRLGISLKRTKNEILTTALASIGFFSCITFVSLRTLNGQNTIGDIALFLVVFPQMFNTLQYLSSGISLVYQNNIFIRSIFELFELKSRLACPANPAPIPRHKNAGIKLKHVSFTYPHAAKPALIDISLQVPAGKIVGVVGLNGAGKTTLIKLLCRLYDADSGQITLGGTDIRDFDPEAYRRQIGVVFQDYVKYNFPVRDNIRFGDVTGAHPEEDIMEAAVKSGAHDFIREFPGGYRTMMGRLFADGREVSIGQWQKLAIARAFYSNARFLIFDEATSALDAPAEKALFDTFRQRIGNRSALIISHRHSAVQHADHIYVLAGGRVIQSGTDEELLAVEGAYRRLFKKDRVAADTLI